MQPKPTVAVTRKLTQAAEQRLGELFDVRFNTSGKPLSQSQLKEVISNADAIICTVSDSINSEILKVPQRRASIIANIGVGYTNIDIKTAESEGVVVTNTPDVLTDATADVAMLLILSVTRRASFLEKLLRDGEWQGFSVSSNLGASIQGKTLGIVGMGRIGQAVAKRAYLGFGMKIAYFNRSQVSGLDIPAERHDDLASLMRTADVISLHIPGMAGGSPLITETLISEMKPSAFLINTARGDVIDQKALVAALVDKKIAGAGLDVYENEPRVPDELVGLDNVTLLPHIGSATTETRDAMGMLAVENLIAHFGDGNYPSRVI